MGRTLTPEHQSGGLRKKPQVDGAENAVKGSRSSGKCSSDHGNSMPGAALKNMVKEAVRTVHDQIRYGSTWLLGCRFSAHVIAFYWGGD